MNFVEPIRDERDIFAIANHLKEWNVKYYIMFTIGINLGLRINEILKLRVVDVKCKKEFVIRQSKTGKELPIVFNSHLLKVINEYCSDKNNEEALVPGRNKYKPLGRVQAYRVLSKAAKKFNVPNIGTHTLRKTCGHHYYKKTHDIATLQIWFNHYSEKETLRYIGIDREKVKKAMIEFKLPM